MIVDWARLGERLGQKFINPETRWGWMNAKAVTVVLLIAGGGVGAYLAKGDGTNDPSRCHTPPGKQMSDYSLRGVYRPFRLRVIDECVTETVTVIEARRERDGDYHVGVIPESEGLINDINRARQHGLLLVEWVPGDPRPKSFRTGMRLRLTGTLVEDLQHGPAALDCRQKDWPCGGRKRGWRELHPIFAVEEVIDSGLAPAPKAAPIPGEAED